MGRIVLLLVGLGLALSFEWGLGLEGRAEEKIELCGESHLRVLEQLEEGMESSFKAKGELSKSLAAARSACTRFAFEKNKQGEKLAEAKLEDWNQKAAELCESYFDADAKKELYSAEADQRCIGSVYRSQLSTVKSLVKGLKPICELMQDTQEMDTESACAEMKSSRAEKLRL